MHKWLSVVGIGEDGLPGLSQVACSLVEKAEVLVGGSRHLSMLPEDDTREKLIWSSPIATSVENIIQHRGQSVCILASGDPMCFGIGVTLTRRIPISEITIIPAPSSFSLACSRLGWALQEVETLTLAARPISLLHPVIYPGARLLILSEGRNTPAIVAQTLVDRGYGNSKITVLEYMGGEREQIIEGIAAEWKTTKIGTLNTIAIECIADADILQLPRIAGLPDIAYHHDGQLTKREVRAITLAALAPIPGQMLWDIGAGCGSISIEWMRTHPRCWAIAIEQNYSRLNYIADNAASLGTPNLRIIHGESSTVLKGLQPPDAIFIGGGITEEGIFDTCWHALRTGGRLVANAVTVESESKLIEWHNQVGGSLTRIAIQRAQPVGKFLGWKPMLPVTQWAVVKE
ncbi:precorrin-6y C5,15-methyltransferase (decarboxylating), CbiE subunit,precorrin-6Y C5,15-methyltransferase (decarboxylating), CbiT subunit [Rivularia sp. PCC 7116]|uniref:bifunctional cobalt-precorrin-7 (C(5))-methyltransferase/cobalt-precorrin-6B (C(15))-methyltransferase n=1 Tax=Rivularia sp. PCC 7116 TaxID=373994 RepID=UPI00029ED0EA|nr:bifunctional cobalt-precorrin-7 (C(5))-methyltransferase/cobalt-precorrin-6B (C(15))-methyltransferase [Rivularia sp. PCC 7116]AFY56247.1 precorrin-6y C5,15-methyltransferase (decarboxylating), CbiE subunit,precorrin-6Y C5,15-methyltransferase (decarboxylating), CbiT subunit [Rivularia sp. PCC 7116]